MFILCFTDGMLKIAVLHMKFRIHPFSVSQDLYSIPARCEKGHNSATYTDLVLVSLVSFKLFIFGV